MVKKRIIKRKRLEGPISVADELGAILSKMGFSPARGKLSSLWRNWAQVMGEDLAEVALPLTTRGKELVIGAENSMHMMELYYVTDEIREKANIFLGEEFFDSVFITLAPPGKNCLPSENFTNTASDEGMEDRFRPTVTGKYLAEMDPNSPVARCYALFSGKKI